MPKPTNTQELTARYLAAGAGFKPEEQFFALLNAASHVVKERIPVTVWKANFKPIHENFSEIIEIQGQTLEPLADDKAPF